MAAVRLCVERLEISPLSLNVSVVSAERGMLGQGAFNPLASFFDALGMLVTGIERAPFRLGGLQLVAPFLSAPELAGRMKTHYTRAAVFEAYKALGYSDLLGSPAGLLLNLGSGVIDFVREPVAAAGSGSALAVGAGVLRGTASLLRNTLAGTANATHRISASLGKGIAALSMDADFIDERNKRLSMHPAADRVHQVGAVAARVGAVPGGALGRGLFDSGLLLGRAFVQGATGIVQAPVEGAARDGIRGAFQGVARGLVGAAIKPAAGVLEGLERGSEALRHATADGSGAGVGSRGRVRPRRAGVRAGVPLSRFDLLAASLAEVLETSGACSPDERVLLYLGVGSHTIVCTAARVLCLRSTRWTPAWAVRWSEIIGVQLLSARARVSLRCRPPDEQPLTAGGPSSSAAGAHAHALGAGGQAHGGHLGEGAVGHEIECDDLTTCRCLYDELQALLRASRVGAPPFDAPPSGAEAATPRRRPGSEAAAARNFLTLPTR
ncbi:hypothetical protein T492DRAFT_477350 [Pavlovales sp. CCMP2436]|nr:hypothetical protein T492DRAFT_477350 [Pavlovales sp. CCMP2436]